jgi:hypothetical protein
MKRPRGESSGEEGVRDAFELRVRVTRTGGARMARPQGGFMQLGHWEVGWPAEY